MSDRDRLRRWTDSGAHWQVRRLLPDRVEVELLSCDRGEVMDVLRSEDPDLIDYLRAHGDDEGA